ncbi:MAG: DUF4197 domain-containing protein [Humidesulfovibrio sp.]|uniref:DUF4197 domain-containing protein n=1 Tax=Humidesulfovibrio sp. TaxID=2910988 RepID=UPI0027FB459C|nr:DUF4197 domain-containing protein [Humidesulfovibrio sp.]MDQ7835054.1 DUF4197 domain-containing protein [Humidesulfovibrio sp.]
MKRAMVLALALSVFSTPALAGWADVLDKVQSQMPVATSGSSTSSGGIASSLSELDASKGLKEALAKGTQKAVASLGKSDGFFGNQAVKILLPESLQKLETPLRLAGQGKLVDDLVLAMNRAAEKAVPQAAGILGDAVKNMSVQDAKGILSGPEDSATQYFRKSSGAKIGEMMQPIITKAMDSVGVGKAFNKLAANPIAAGLAQNYGLDLNGYINAKAQDGLFALIAQEEKSIRENPAARTTEILKKVFGGR